MKVWIFSVVVHLLLLWALLWVRFVPEQKAVAPVVISTYSYTQVRPKPAALATVKPRPPENMPQQSARSVKPLPKVAAKVENSPESNKKATKASAGIAQNTEQKSQPVTGTLSLADRALASAAAMASASVAPGRPMPEVLQGSVQQGESELTPALIKEVKRYADGSLLVEGAHGCWKVPPAELAGHKYAV